MEIVRNIDSNAKLPVLFSTALQAFQPLLKARQARISSTTKKTFAYGPTARHQLDVYYAPPGASNTPILFFIYGGGFVRGSRADIPNLVHDNLGSFFAQRGIITVIMDYSLAPAATYPIPVEDICSAIRFVLVSPQVDITGNGGDKGRLYVMGHSSGGAHAATLFLNESILSENERTLFKGAVLSAGAFESAPFLAPYYGEPAAEVGSKTPLGLLKMKSPERLNDLLPPRILFLVAENDIPFLVEWGDTFKGTLREKGITRLEEITMYGHNHLSSIFSLNAGEGEEWGEEVANWLHM